MQDTKPAPRFPLALLLAAVPVLVSGSIEASDPPLLSLDEAVAIALEGNHRLGAATAEARMAEADVEAAASGRLPRVELAETFSRTVNPAMVFTNLLGQEAFREENFDIERLNRPDALNNFNTRLSVFQPVYRAGRTKSRLEAARRTSEAADSSLERTRQEVVRDVIESYSGAVLAGRQLGVVREALETAGANVALVSDLREAGLVVESDLLQARVRVTEVEEMLARAESVFEVSRASVNLVLGRSLDTPFRLPETLARKEAVAEDLDALTEAAILARPDLVAAEHRVRAAEHAVRGSRAGYLPEIGFTGMYELNDEDFLDADGSNWSVILGLRFTAFDGHATRSRVRRSQEQLRKSRRMRELARQSVGLEVREAYYGLRAARKSEEQAGRAVGLAEESLRIVRDRYGEGLTTWVELLDAETALTRARTRQVAAQRDVLVSQANLDLATGRL